MGDKFLTSVSVDLGFKGTNLLQINIFRLSKIALSLSDIARGDGRGFSKTIQ